MRPFRYERATDAGAAVSLLNDEPEGQFLGGGTNLVDLMRLGVQNPRLLVDVTGVGGDSISVSPDGTVRIGAAVTNSRLASDAAVRRSHPVLSQALLNGASGQLRNLATVAGNLLQRTRCLYFQDVTKPCNKRAPGTGCPARSGEHHNLAILGHSEHCVATHPSDMAVALAAVDASVELQGPDGIRSVWVTDLHRLPEDHPERDTVLAHGELITAVTLPPLGVAAHSIYRKVRERRSYAFALVSVAGALSVQDGVVDEVRLAFGGVAHKPWRATAAEAALRGARADEASFAAALDAELAAVQPLADNAYKVPMLRRVALATLLELAQST